jgi:hypothetical protein
MNQNANLISFKPVVNSHTGPHYVSLVNSEFDVEPVYQEILPEFSSERTIKPYFLEKKMKEYTTIRMSPLTQMYVASLTVVGLFIVFRLSLPK